MKFSLGLPAGEYWADGSPVSPDDLVLCAKAAEDAGFDAVYATDHPFPPHAWRSAGGHGTLDPFVALSFVASTTTKIRLHTNLVVAGYRNPFVTAKMASTLDILSSGRLILGMGSGYLEGEFDALGARFADRGILFDEAIRAMKQAWSGSEVEFQGTGYMARGNVMQPRPAQDTFPPIWIGGNSRAAIRRAVLLADGWCPMPSTHGAARVLATPGIESTDELRRKIAYASECSVEFDRATPLTICFTPVWAAMPALSMPDYAEASASVAELTAMGVGWLTVAVPAVSRSEMIANITGFGDGIVRAAVS